MSDEAEVGYAHELRCQELIELVTDYLEGTMTPAVRLRFEQHLARCEGCANYLAEMRATLQVAGMLREEWIAPAAKAGLLAVFRDWKRAARIEPDDGR